MTCADTPPAFSAHRSAKVFQSSRCATLCPRHYDFVAMDGGILALHLRVASIPFRSVILNARRGPGIGWTHHKFHIPLRINCTQSFPYDFAEVLHVTSWSTTTTTLVNIACPSDQIACMIFRACRIRLANRNNQSGYGRHLRPAWPHPRSPGYAFS